MTGTFLCTNNCVVRSRHFGIVVLSTFMFIRDAMLSSVICLVLNVMQCRKLLQHVLLLQRIVIERILIGKLINTSVL